MKNIKKIVWLSCFISFVFSFCVFAQTFPIKSGFVAGNITGNIELLPAGDNIAKIAIDLTPKIPTITWTISISWENPSVSVRDYSGNWENSDKEEVFPVSNCFVALFSGNKDISIELDLDIGDLDFNELAFDVKIIASKIGMKISPTPEIVFASKNIVLKRNESSRIDVPNEFALGTNYPNPFNKATTIRYAMPISGSVKIEIFDILGRKIRNLEDSEKNAGFYSAIWDGKNLDGNEVSSGVYFAKMSAGNYSQVRKIEMIK